MLFFQLRVRSYSGCKQDDELNHTTAGVYLCTLSLPLSSKQCHHHSSRTASDGLVVLFHTHYGIQPYTWYQANNRNLPGPACHLEAGPKDYIEELHKTKEKTYSSDHLLYSELLKPANVTLRSVRVLNLILRLSNNSSSLNKGDPDCDGVWISDLNYHSCLWFYFSVFSLILVSIEKICQTLKTVFEHISKHPEVCQKYSAARRIFNSLLGDLNSGQTRSFMFDILHLNLCCAEITERDTCAMHMHRDTVSSFLIAIVETTLRYKVINVYVLHKTRPIDSCFPHLKAFPCEVLFMSHWILCGGILLPDFKLWRTRYESVNYGISNYWST